MVVYAVVSIELIGVLAERGFLDYYPRANTVAAFLVAVLARGLQFQPSIPIFKGMGSRTGSVSVHSMSRSSMTARSDSLGVLRSIRLKFKNF